MSLLLRAVTVYRSVQASAGSVVSSSQVVALTRAVSRFTREEALSGTSASSSFSDCA